MSGDERNERAYRAVNGRSPRTEPKPAPAVLDFHGSLNLLYARVKSQNQLATMLGVPRRTLRRWLDGGMPSRTAGDRARRQIVEESAKRIIRTDDNAATQAERRKRLTLAREARMRRATRVEVKARLRYSDEGGARNIVFNLESDLVAGAVDQVIDAYLNGASANDGAWIQNDGIFAPVAYGMTDEWYREAFLDPDPNALAFDVENVRFL